MSRFSPRFLLVAALFAAASSLAAQRPLTHDDYDQWRSLRGTSYSQDGTWVAFQIEPQWGDGVLEIRESVGDKVYRQPLASGAHFSSDGRFVVFTIGKSKVEERNKKIEELRKKAKAGNQPAAEGEGEKSAAGEESTPGETPRRGAFGGSAQGPAGGRGPGRRGGGAPDEGAASRDRGELAVLDLSTGQVEKLGKVKGSLASDDAPWLLYHLDKPEAKPKPKADGSKPDEPKAEGNVGEGAGEAAKGETTAAGEAKAGEPAAERPREPREPGQRRGGGRRGGAGRGNAGGAAPAMPEGHPKSEAKSEEGGAKPEAKPEGATEPEAKGEAVTGKTSEGAAATDPLEKKRPEGTELVVRDLTTGSERKIADVVAYGVSRHSKWLWYHTSAKRPQADHHYGLFVEPLAGGTPVQLLDGNVHVANLTWDRAEAVLAFTSDKEDFAADKPTSDLYLWEGEGPARRIAYAGAPGLPDGKRVVGGLSFSRDGSVLEFDIQDAPAADPLPILPEDKVALDIWNWRDGQLQTAQQKRGNGERNPSWSAVWHRDQNRLIVLGDEQLRSLRFVGPDGARMLGTDGRAYEKETTWDGRYADVWLVNTLQGTRTKVLDRLRGNVTNSPGGRYLVWFGADYHWWSYDVSSGVRTDLTGQLPVAFHQEDDDHPEPDSPHGLAGWTEGDAAVLLYDEFDLWKVSPATGDAVCVTDGYGRANRLRLRVQRLPRDDDHDWLEDPLLLAATKVDTMGEGFFTASLARAQKPQRLVFADKNFGELTRPRHSERLFFTQSTFAQFPDLWTAARDFSGLRQLSHANPQQQDYRWGKAELVHWVDGDGNQRSGVLVKPDGFDPKKKYPMLVYFYERMSQSLHNYVAPAPGTSPNASYYVSNGYLWFMPDVVYQVGYPGESCVKCVVSGVQHLIAQGFVDEKAIGAAGHSWGGYQTAFLVTRTNIFKAVESGAPVSNMLSAYGGIRYESGVSRQFQYEQTQSRIGGTPWQYPLRYQENSPIYFADKVHTPVLIMANDQDGAVPWTQGIEYFTALRRLGKECYLFNYNGEPHGLRLRQNMKDWTRRMSEYFAHHLRGAPAPKWMSDGVPYYERDAEKLAFASSYIDAYVKPAPAAMPATEAAPAASKPAPAAATPSTDDKSDTATTQPGRRAGRGPNRAADAVVASTKLGKGEAAPDFRLPDQSGEVHQLADYRGRHLLVWFYPKADTPGCTAEGCGLRDHFDAFLQQDVAVLGVSVDPVADNAAFREKYDLPFPLLSDVERTMAIAYGAAADASAKFARRIAVLIDGDGKVVRVWSTVDPRTFAATAAAALPL